MKCSDEYPIQANGQSGMVTFFDDGSIVICVGMPNRTPTECAGTMMHELMHVVQYVERAMYPYDENGRLDSETQAYLLSELAMWGLDIMQECGFFGGKT
jgi:hypothetical protein